MAQNSSRPVGRHFLHIPGPTPVPDRILRAMDTPIIDHRGPEFSRIAKKALEGIKTIFKTTNPVIIYTATGTGAWEGALVNTLSPGDKVLMVETGQFATLWKKMAEKLGVKPEFITSDWRNGADPKAIEARLREDKGKEIKAVCVLHNETSTGCLSPIPSIRKAIDAAGHPALFMVDTISSLASTDYADYAHPLAVMVSRGDVKRGVLLCGTGLGMAYAANRHPHVRAAVVWSPEIAELSRKHNDANVLVLPSRFLSPEDAGNILDVFLSTDFDGGRHTRRVEKIEREESSK